jgi:hypothetical protein
MGIYINTTSAGEPLPRFGKATALIADGARIVSPKFQPNLICVVTNDEMFDAALYCETEEEFRRTLRREDTRKKVYLVHPAAESIKDT